MNIKEIVSSIPNVIAKHYKKIYLANKDKNELYVITYKGSKTSVSTRKDYKELEEFLKDYNTDIEIILKNEREIYETNKVGKDLIIVDTIDSYKLIYIIDIDTPKKESAKKHKIIVADDSFVITKFLTRIFESEYDVLVAHNGDEVIKIIEENDLDDVDGCFLDLNMPVANGFKVLDYFRDNNLFKTVPVSIISGEDDQDTVSKVTIEYDVVDMLPKPFDKEAIRNIVSKTINFYK